MRADRKDDEYLPPMPPVDAGHHLIGYLMEIGPVLSSGMGVAPLPFSEIEAWQEATGIELHAWEARLIRRLSREYLATSQSSTDLKAPSPWSEEKPDVAKTAKGLRASLRALSGM